MSRFFIDRPIFAMVCSIIITLAGVVCMLTLPIAQYPPIVPPTIQVTATYPGANAQVVSNTVAQPIEEQVNGVEGMIYMSSTSTNQGTYSLTVSFEIGTDIHMALVLVQTRVQLAMPQLPESVQAQGLDVQMQSPNLLLSVQMISPDNRYDQLFMSNYAEINVFDELSRLPGVALVNVLGQRQYSMRAWLDPQKLAALNIVASEVTDAIRQQNVVIAAGSIGQEPAPPGQTNQLPLQLLGRLTSIEEFGKIIVKVGDNGRIVRLRDVARLELGSQNEDTDSKLDGMPAVLLAIFPLPQANALDVAKQVRETMVELKKDFPEGLEYAVAYDTTPFILHSIIDVVTTLLIAIALVAVVVIVFLQNWRAALIPLVAVPVAIVGTFIAMAALGFSLNTLSLFGLVLAIGIVVDDAIVVVENVERWLEEGHHPKDAARKAMDEVTGPIVAVMLVLCAVFVPCAFIPGLSGEFFRQFALTIAISTVISAFNSLTLSPALAALLLCRREEMKDPLTRLFDTVLGWFFRLFNKVFDALAGVYIKIVGVFLRVTIVVLLVYVGLLGVTYVSFTHYPTGLIPQQDQGHLIINVALPDSASIQRTEKVLGRITDIVMKVPGVAHSVEISGYSIILSAEASNWGTVLLPLSPFSERTTPETQAAYLVTYLNKVLQKEILDAQVTVMGAPPVPGLGQSGGFQLQINDQSGLGLQALQEATDAVVAAANHQPALAKVFTNFTTSAPQVYVDVNREMAKTMDIDLSDLFSTLNINVGSEYINLFNEFGRVWQVNVQAEGANRNELSDLALLQVRNKQGQMVPIGSLINLRPATGPTFVMRYNDTNSAPVLGGSAPGFSDGQTINVMEKLCKQYLPTGMGYDWTNLSYQEVTAGNTGVFVFGFAVLLVFLVLSALYESWGLPFAIILVVPMCLLCSLAGISLVNKPMDIFVQIGFVVLVGLAAKNAILIVEFAKQKQEEGAERREATLEACRLRLRPILMTSFAFIAGVYPLVVATGAGWEMRRSLGTAVFSGMIGVTLFGVFLTPVFFYVIARFNKMPVKSEAPASKA